MTTNNLAAQLDDIFNIPRDGSNIAEDDLQEAAYADASGGDIQTSFLKKASELNDKLSAIPTAVQEKIQYVDMPQKQDEPKSTRTEEPPKQAPKPEEVVNHVEKIVSKPAVEKQSDESMRSIISEAVSAAKSAHSESVSVAPKPTASAENSESPVHEEGEHEVRSQLPDVSGTENIHTQEFIGVENEDDWLLESPAPRYSNFYLEKKKMLPKLLRGGKLPIESFSSELNAIKIDTTVDMYDHINIANKMNEIRKWQTRIMEIRGRVLSQYFRWKRAIELWRGILAKAEYSKPAIAQEGTVYNHMRDMEMYFTDLEYLYEFTENLLKNLDGSFDSLSRQVTLSMPLKNVERYEQSATPTVTQNTQIPPTKLTEKRHDLTSFDRLENVVEDKGINQKMSNSNSTEPKPKKASSWSSIR